MSCIGGSHPYIRETVTKSSSLFTLKKVFHDNINAANICMVPPALRGECIATENQKVIECAAKAAPLFQDMFISSWRAWEHLLTLGVEVVSAGVSYTWIPVQLLGTEATGSSQEEPHL